MKRGFFFDMDGVIWDSMPHHAEAWEETMRNHGLSFSVRDCYMNEGRTGRSVITECFMNTFHRPPSEEEYLTIYQEKTDGFYRRGVVQPIKGIKEVLTLLKEQTPLPQIWVVTGSGQKTLFDELNEAFPNIFAEERMITAFDVQHGKPHPEPYLKAWERSGLDKSECCVIENAPLGIHAAKAAGLFTVGVQTGILSLDDLRQAGADRVFSNMQELKDSMLSDVSLWWGE